MLYPTLNQPAVIFAMLGVGLVSGLLIDGGRILAWLTGEGSFARHFFDFIALFFSCGLLIFVNLMVNYGQFRIYVFVIFILSLMLERFLSKILWTKLISKCYTNVVAKREKITKRISWKKRKRKN